MSAARHPCRVGRRGAGPKAGTQIPGASGRFEPKIPRPDSTTTCRPPEAAAVPGGALKPDRHRSSRRPSSRGRPNPAPGASPVPHRDQRIEARRVSRFRNKAASRRPSPSRREDRRRPQRRPFCRALARFPAPGKNRGAAPRDPTSLNASHRTPRSCGSPRRDHRELEPRNVSR